MCFLHLEISSFLEAISVQGNCHDSDGSLCLVIPLMSLHLDVVNGFKAGLLYFLFVTVYLIYDTMPYNAFIKPLPLLIL